MSLCINPVCPKPNHQDNDQNRFCLSCGSQLELLGRYRVMRLLSDKTGFSKVYQAYEQDTPKILKVLKEELSGKAEAVELFQQEVTVLGKMNHPGIPNMDSYFQYQTRNGLVLHCIAMEKIDGLNLEQWLKQQQSISQKQAIAWLKQLLKILDSVHSQQYLHRDIKPSNIIIRPLTKESLGELVLIDFGTAREMAKSCPTQLSNCKGMTAIMSSGYSAPEQMSGQAVPQSDFFALGRTFVFLLTGYHPLDMYDIHYNLLHWQNHAINISPLLLNLIDWLMTLEIGNRPANAEEILQRLEEIEEQLIEINVEIVNIEESLKTENLTLISTNKTSLPQHNQLDKVPLASIFTALLVTLGLVSIMALTLWHTKLTSDPNYGQSPTIKGKIDYFPYEKGRDSQGRVAEFNIVVLSVEYRWLLGSTFQVKYNDQIISLELLNLNIEQEEIQKIMKKPSEIISVGTASCKGDVGVEQRIALERSRQIQFLAKKLFSNTPSIKGYRLLNLGQFQRSNCQASQDLTAYQRSIIIIGVKQKSADVILDEALRNRLEEKPFADFRLEDYSLGSAERFKTVPSNL
ncbi:serine/threonine protein kinase [Komarekiella sp. 'clone 1']|uniref:non-specific serine/threonine protein kinase n=1 Tax=Komarekiella delphini-convector SJRDD-AB1 TaxID=2593771 RepID=A0AA40T234_9NOST|nr:serine/threonine-protein kinase [Komarekiella delphini-convector]MBD6619192.1 serine/threonine protein kinase [Komarekiella delphini-convector SJRDD-AB1]